MPDSQGQYLVVLLDRWRDDHGYTLVTLTGKNQEACHISDGLTLDGAQAAIAAADEVYVFDETIALVDLPRRDVLRLPRVLGVACAFPELADRDIVVLASGASDAVVGRVSRGCVGDVVRVPALSLRETWQRIVAADPTLRKFVEGDPANHQRGLADLALALLGTPSKQADAVFSGLPSLETSAPLASDAIGHADPRGDRDALVASGWAGSPGFRVLLDRLGYSPIVSLAPDQDEHRGLRALLSGSMAGYRKLVARARTGVNQSTTAESRSAFERAVAALVGICPRFKDPAAYVQLLDDIHAGKAPKELLADAVQVAGLEPIQFQSGGELLASQLDRAELSGESPPDDVEQALKQGGRLFIEACLSPGYLVAGTARVIRKAVVTVRFEEPRVRRLVRDTKRLLDVGESDMLRFAGEIEAGRVSHQSYTRDELSMFLDRLRDLGVQSGRPALGELRANWMAYFRVHEVKLTETVSPDQLGSKVIVEVSTHPAGEVIRIDEVVWVGYETLDGTDVLRPARVRGSTFSTRVTGLLRQAAKRSSGKDRRALRQALKEVEAGQTNVLRLPTAVVVSAFRAYRASTPDVMTEWLAAAGIETCQAADGSRPVPPGLRTIGEPHTVLLEPGVDLAPLPLGPVLVGGIASATLLPVALWGVAPPSAGRLLLTALVLAVTVSGVLLRRYNGGAMLLLAGLLSAAAITPRPLVAIAAVPLYFGAVGSSACQWLGRAKWLAVAVSYLLSVLAFLAFASPAADFYYGVLDPPWSVRDVCRTGEAWTPTQTSFREFSSSAESIPPYTVVAVLADSQAADGATWLKVRQRRRPQRWVRAETVTDWSCFRVWRWRRL
jgi:hypothetical protein